jgi:hypothetical protein
MTALLRTNDGAAVRLVASAGERGQLVMNRAAPPGTPLLLSNDAGLTLQLKVNRCQKVGSEFHIEGRWVSLTRDDKAWLDQQVQDLSGSKRNDHDPTP